MTNQVDYTPLSKENLEILAPFDADAAYELYQREEHESGYQAYQDFLDEQDAQDETCIPEEGICFCGLCLDDRLENPEPEPTQVWYTESPCGHNGWE